MLSMILFVFPCILFFRQVSISLWEAQVPKSAKQCRLMAKIDKVNKRLNFKPGKVVLFVILLYVAIAGLTCKVAADYNSMAEVVDHPILSNHVKWMAFINVSILSIGVRQSISYVRANISSDSDSSSSAALDYFLTRYSGAYIHSCLLCFSAPVLPTRRSLRCRCRGTTKYVSVSG